MRRVLLAAILTGAAVVRAASAVPLAFVDDSGWTVTVVGSAQRVVSVSPGATEIVFALGAGKRLVGTCTYCDHPAAAKACPRVGDYANPSLEAIVAARPDLVVTGGPQRELVLHLRAAGIPTAALLPASIEGVLGNIRDLGHVLGREAAARALIARLRGRIARVADEVTKAPGAARPRVYFEIWADPFTAIGDATYPGELIRLAGGDNIARGAPGDYPKLSAEAILAADPDVIILSHSDNSAGPLAEVARRPGWAGLKAVKTGRVYADLNMDLIVRSGPRLADGLEQLRSRLRPK